MTETVEKARPKMGFTELGRTGLSHSGGQINEEFLTSLQASRGIKIYKEMRDNDPIIGAVMMAIMNLVRQTEWNVEPFDESTSAQADADFMKECMEDMNMSWSDLVSDIMSMIIFGWSFFEIVYKVREGGPLHHANSSKFTDGKIGWKKLAIRSQDSLDGWDMTERGEVKAMRQSAFPDFTIRTIPMSKSLLFRTSVWKDNPQGRSILRNAYRPWFFKKRMEEVEGIGIERDLNGIPIAFVPPQILLDDANPEEKQTLAAIVEMVKNIRNDSQAGIVLPSVYDENSNKLFTLDLLTTLGKRNFDLNATINRMNLTIATSMLADFVLIGHTAVGSFAMASSKTKVFSTAIGSYLDTITDVFNRRAIPMLMELNGNATHEIPRLVHGDIETIDLENLADYLNSLSAAGIDLTGEDMLRHLATQAGMPEEGLTPKPEPTVESGSLSTQPFTGGDAKVTPDGIGDPDE